jgi:hypothetical protein
MTLPSLTKKWIVTGVIAFVVLSVVIIAFVYEPPTATALCSREIERCNDACLIDPKVLVGLGDLTKHAGTNNTLLTCLANCLNANTCEEKDTLFQAIPGKNQILLQFRDPNSSYSIFLDGEEIDLTTDTFYMIQNLVSETAYEVAVKKMESGEEEIDYLYTLSQEQRKVDQQIAAMIDAQDREIPTKKLDEAFYKSFLHVHVSKHQIQLTIHGLVPSDDNIFQVYRDDQQIGTMKNGSFTDRKIQSGKIYDYSVRTAKTIPQKEIEQRKQTLRKMYPDADNETLQTLDDMFGCSRSNYRLEKSNVETIEAIQLFRNASVHASNKDGPYYLRYITFIPWQYIENPLYWVPGVDTKYFNGNNRGFKATTPIDKDLKYKTWAEVKADFSKKKVGSSVRVGLTIGYDKNKKKLWQHRADYHCMELTAKDLSKSDRYTWSFYHGCGMPWPGWAGQLPPDVDYLYDAKVSKNGNWEVKGIHDECPSHEVYIAREGNQGKEKSWAIIHRATSSKEFVLPIGIGGGLSSCTVKISNSGKTPA